MVDVFINIHSAYIVYRTASNLYNVGAIYPFMLFSYIIQICRHAFVNAALGEIVKTDGNTVESKLKTKRYKFAANSYGRIRLPQQPRRVSLQRLLLAPDHACASGARHNNTRIFIFAANKIFTTFVRADKRKFARNFQKE